MRVALTEGNAVSSSSAQGLTKLLADQAPGCIKENKFENYFGRKIAVDASMHIYSFLVRGAEASRAARAGRVGRAALGCGAHALRCAPACRWSSGGRGTRP